MNATDLIHRLHTCPSVSYWLKDAINANLGRDAVDAYHDAELLAKVMRQRLDEIQGGVR